MKLIEEIKKAEEQGELLKKNAALEGQKLVQKARERGDRDLAALDSARDKELEKELEKAKKTIDKKIANITAEYEQSTKKIDESFKKNREKTIRQIQDIILKWPSSR